MADATKNIRFKTSIEGSDQVKGQFDEINHSIDKTSDVADNKLKPSMVDAQQYTMRVGKAAQETTSKFAGLVGGLIGGAGLVAVFALGQLAVTAISDALKEANKESDMLAESFQRLTEQMIKIQNPFEGGIFEVKPEQLDSLIKGLDFKIKALESQATTFARLEGIAYGGMTPEDIKLQDAQIERNEVLIEYFKTQKIELEAQKELMDMMSELGIDWVSKQKTITGEILEDWIAIAKIIDKDIAGADMEPDILGDVGPMPEGFGMGMAYKQKGPRERRFEALDEIFGKEKEQKQRQEQFVNSWVNIMELNFSSFWEKTFGEANSILEQMLMTTFGAIFSNLMSGLLSFIPGGSIIGAIGSLFSSPVSGGGNNQPLVIQIGDVDVARVVLRGNQVIQQRRLS